MRSTKSHILDRARTKYAGIFACVFAFVLSVALCPGVAQAEVRNSDVVLGQTIEEQGFTAAQAPNIVAEYAYLVSSDGTIYFARNAYDQVHIASITKIMTALVALDYGGDPTQTEITVSQEAASIGESTAGLRAGDRLRTSQAQRFVQFLQAMMQAKPWLNRLGRRSWKNCKRIRAFLKMRCPRMAMTHSSMR